MPGPVAGGPPPAPASGGPRVKVLASAVGAVALAGIAFAVFGGSGSTGIDPVAQAATVSARAPGYQMHMSMQITGLQTALTATGDGTFDLRDHSGSMSMSMNFGDDPRIIQTLGSNTLKMQEIIDGATVYIKLPAAVTSGMQLLGKQWIAVNLAKATGVPGLSSLDSNPVSSDPSQMLQYLKAESDSIVNEGQAVVDGLATTHYHADINLDRVASSLPAADQAAAQQALAKLAQLTQIHQLPVDVWVDARRLVRRMEMTLSTSLPGGQALNESFTLDITHYGPEPQPQLPPAGEVANLG
jgi:hypothetical protein